MCSEPNTFLTQMRRKMLFPSQNASRATKSSKWQHIIWSVARRQEAWAQLILLGWRWQLLGRVTRGQHAQAGHLYQLEEVFLALNRPTEGVLTEASVRCFTVTYAADCQAIYNSPAPATKVRRVCVCPCAFAKVSATPGATRALLLNLRLNVEWERWRYGLASASGRIPGGRSTRTGVDLLQLRGAAAPGSAGGATARAPVPSTPETAAAPGDVSCKRN